MSAHEINPPVIEVFQDEVDAAVAKWFAQHPLGLKVACGAVTVNEIHAGDSITVQLELDEDLPDNCVIKAIATRGVYPQTGLSFTLRSKQGRTVVLEAVADSSVSACLLTVTAYALV